MICRKCGCRVSDDASYCMKCGAPMEEFGKTDPEMVKKVGLQYSSKAIFLVLLSLFLLLAIVLFVKKDRLRKPFGLEAKSSYEEVKNVLGEPDDFDSFDTIIEGVQYLYCWKNTELGNYSGTLQANFCDVDSIQTLGYLRFQPDSANEKELVLYAEKKYGKSGNITSEDVLYTKDVGDWHIIVSVDGDISWRDTSVMQLNVSRPW